MWQMRETSKERKEGTFETFHVYTRNGITINRCA